MKKTLTQKIGLLIRERREAKNERQEIDEILRQNGYATEIFESMDDEDVTIFGNPRVYKTTFNFGKPFFEEGSERYAVVPVRGKEEFYDETGEALVLIDRKEKKVRGAILVGYKDREYRGNGKTTPLSLKVENDVATIAYRFAVHPGLMDDIFVSTTNSVFEGNLFRDSENCIARVKLEDIK